MGAVFFDVEAGGPGGPPRAAVAHPDVHAALLQLFYQSPDVLQHRIVSGQTLLVLKLQFSRR